MTTSPSLTRWPAVHFVWWCDMTPTDWDRAYRKGTLRQPEPLPELDSDIDDMLDWAVAAACCIVIGGIALWGILR